MSWSAIVLQFLGLLVLPLATVIAVVQVVLGRVRRTRACCPRCRTELAAATLVRREGCPTCGASAEEAPPVPVVERPAWRALPFALLFAALAVGAVMLGNRAGLARAAAMAIVQAGELDNATLIAGAFAANHPMDGALVELARRVRIGRCAPAEIRAVAERGFVPVASLDAVRRIAALAILDGTLDAEARGAILAGPFAPAWPTSLDPAGLAERPLRLDLDSGPSRGIDTSLTRVVVADRIVVDGVPVERPADAPPWVLGWRRGLPIRPPTLETLPAGAQTIVIEGEALYLDRAAAQVLEMIGVELARERWPRPIARHPIRLEARLPDPESGG